MNAHVLAFYDWQISCLLQGHHYRAVAFAAEQARLVLDSGF